MCYREKTLHIVKNDLNEALLKRKEWYEYLSSELKSTRKQVCIFGTGMIGVSSIYEWMKKNGGKIDFFCDNDEKKCGTVIVDDIACISFRELEKYADNVIVLIASGKASKDIFDQLVEKSFDCVVEGVDFMYYTILEELLQLNTASIIEKVNRLFDLLADEESQKAVYDRFVGICKFTSGYNQLPHYYHCEKDQYFCKDIVKFRPDDVIVDCGAFTGDTILEFMKLNVPIKQYISFELNRNNFDILEKTTHAIASKQMEFVNYNLGVGAKDEFIAYTDSASSTSFFEEGCCAPEQLLEGRIVSLSKHLQGIKVSFIKMDIEGAEKAALCGAKAMIVKSHPKLAICIYHSFSDLWEIPLLIRSMFKEICPYKFYIRHHTTTYNETVCYAVDK